LISLLFYKGVVITRIIDIDLFNTGIKLAFKLLLVCYKLAFKNANLLLLLGAGMNINSISLQQNMFVNYSNQQPASIENTQQKSTQDTVTISNTGRALSISQNTQSNNIDRMNNKLDNARNDPDYAKTLAKNLAHSDFLMSIDGSTISEGGDIAVTRYTNGDLVYKASTRTSVQKWEEEAEQYKQENIDLYNTEKEKGTSDINIIMMIMEKNMNLPESFRKQQGNDYV